ncbi:hypothetical protein E2562_023972 [Oryza meyeriana var. granulata]|uniref:Uncharacterized protein n=1 Tax=Oryza meyeriana var. granulata TaxID=110450 RepID=A0A6G1C032_9ORYZ|nr:hypothetical protein E2562_023972 [Oryza meyeriana var. granulata]
MHGGPRRPGPRDSECGRERGSSEAERRNAAADIDGRQWCEAIRRASPNGRKWWRQRGVEVKAKLLSGSDGVAEDEFRRARGLAAAERKDYGGTLGFIGGQRGQGEETKLGERGPVTVTVATAVGKKGQPL